MSVATLSETRAYDRRLEYAREHVVPGIVQNALDASAGCSLFMGRLSDAMFGQAKASNRAKRVHAGESIVGGVRLGPNLTAGPIGGSYGSFDTTPNDSVRHVRQNWVYYGGTVNLDLNTILQAREPRLQADITEEEIKDAVGSLVDSVEQGLYANMGATAITPLTELISAASETPTALGLSGATYANWNSRGISTRGTAPASISFTGGSFATLGLQNWRVAWENACEGNVKPQALLTTHDIKTFYEASLQSQERIMDTRLADGGFMLLQFKEAPVVPAPRCTTGLTLFLNFDYIGFDVLEGADFEVGPFVEPVTQNARVAKAFATLNTCVTGRKYQNKVISQVA